MAHKACLLGSIRVSKSAIHDCNSQASGYAERQEHPCQGLAGLQVHSRWGVHAAPIGSRPLASRRACQGYLNKGMLGCRCTADGVYMQPLADKFARLVLQLLARYAFWVTEGIGTKGSSGTATPPQDGSNPQVSPLLHANVCPTSLQLSHLIQVLSSHTKP